MMRFKKAITILLTVCLMASLAAITVNAARSSTANTHVYSSSSSTGNITGIIGGSTGNGYIAGTGYPTSIVGVIDNNTTSIVDVTGNNTTSIFSVSTGNTTGNGTSVYEDQSADIVGGSVINGYNAGPGYTTSIVGVTGNTTTSIVSVSTGNTTGKTTSSYETHATGIVGSSPVNVYSAGTGSDTGTAISSSRGL
jgi:hypothetical protein